VVDKIWFIETRGNTVCLFNKICMKNTNKNTRRKLIKTKCNILYCEENMIQTYKFKHVQCPCPIVHPYIVSIILILHYLLNLMNVVTIPCKILTSKSSPSCYWVQLLLHYKVIYTASEIYGSRRRSLQLTIYTRKQPLKFYTQ